LSGFIYLFIYFQAWWLGKRLCIFETRLSLVLQDSKQSHLLFFPLLPSSFKVPFYLLSLQLFLACVCSPPRFVEVSYVRTCSLGFDVFLFLFMVFWTLVILCLQIMLKRFLKICSFFAIFLCHFSWGYIERWRMTAIIVFSNMKCSSGFSCYLY
jgi:hypothetical protein